MPVGCRVCSDLPRFAQDRASSIGYFAGLYLPQQVQRAPGIEAQGLWEINWRTYFHAIAFSRSASRTAAFVSCSPVAFARAVVV